MRCDTITLYKKLPAVFLTDNIRCGMRAGSNVRWELSCFVMCIILSLLPASTFALRCLQCEDCSLSVGDPMICRSGQNMCMKLQSRGRVDRTCGTQESCGYGVSEKWGRRIWRQVKQLVSDWGKRSRWERDEDVTEVFCCASDFCNSTSSYHKGRSSSALTLFCVIYSFWTLLV